MASKSGRRRQRAEEARKGAASTPVSREAPSPEPPMPELTPELDEPIVVGPEILARASATAGGPPAGVVTPPNSRTQTHPLIGGSVTRLDSALRAAFMGRPAQLMDLYDDMRDRDGRVDPVCRMRTLVVASRPWSVQPAEGYEQDAEVARIAERVTTLVKRIRTEEGGGWRTVLTQAADAILRGYGAFEIDWRISRERWHYPARLLWRHPNRFVWDQETQELLLADTGKTWSHVGEPLSKFGGPDKWTVHTPSGGRVSYPTRRGIMIGMIFPSLTKRYGLRWWLKATERWGSPIPHAHLPANQADKADDVLDKIRKQMADGVVASWGDISIDALNGTGMMRPEIFSSIVAHSDTAISIIGLGQNLTTEVVGGSFAAAKVSNIMRLDLLAGDLAELDDWATSGIVELILKYNWPQFSGMLAYRTEIEERAEPTIEDVREGIFSPDERRTALGFTAQPDGTGSELRKPQQGQPAVTDPWTQGPDIPAPDAGVEPEKPAEVTLNGAQINSLLTIIQAVATGQLPRKTGINLIVSVFPVTLTQAEDMMGDVGAGFKPAPPEDDAPIVEPSGGAAPADPFRQATAMNAPTSQTPMPTTTSPISAPTMSTPARSLYAALVG